MGNDCYIQKISETAYKTLAMELEKARSIDDMHNAINVYMHDNQTGMPRNMPGPMLYMTEADAKADVPKEPEQNTAQNSSNGNPDKTEQDKSGQEDWELYAASKGGHGNGKGTGKGKG